MEGSTLIHELYTSRTNLLDIMKSQKYIVDEHTGFSIHEINAMYMNEGLDFMIKQEVSGKQAYVKYWLTSSLKQSKIQEITEELFITDNVLDKRDTLIIIVRDEPNDTLKELIKHIYETENIFIVVHHIRRLLFNILNHKLVPKCRILSPEEVDIVKSIYNITNDNQFPKLSRFDPQSLAICFRPGEVIELIRSSKTSCLTKYYRICVNDTAS
jgi:DNA-directed RNA polymerase subunit H (RpoH/RPB5)